MYPYDQIRVINFWIISIGLIINNLCSHRREINVYFCVSQFFFFFLLIFQNESNNECDESNPTE